MTRPEYIVRIDGPRHNPSTVSVRYVGGEPDVYDHRVAVAQVLQDEIQNVLDRTTIGNRTLGNTLGYLTARYLGTDKIFVKAGEISASEIDADMLGEIIERNPFYKI